MTRPATNPSDGWQPAAASTNRTQPTPAIDKCREAETVRRSHVHDWLATAKPTPALIRWTLTELLTAPPAGDLKLTDQLRDLGWASDVLRPIETPTADSWPRSPAVAVQPTASGPRTTIGILTLILADRELATDVHSWRNPNPHSATARYLTFLTEHTGYRLGGVERIAAGQEAAEAVASEAQVTTPAATPTGAADGAIGDPLTADPLLSVPESSLLPAQPTGASR